MEACFLIPSIFFPKRFQSFLVLELGPVLGLVLALEQEQELGPVLVLVLAQEQELGPVLVLGLVLESLWHSLQTALEPLWHSLKTALVLVLGPVLVLESLWHSLQTALVLVLGLGLEPVWHSL